MRIKLNLISNQLLISLFLISIITVSCGSYQTVSYYAPDGIYGTEMGANAKPEQPKINNSGIYFKDYFSNVADDYSSIDNTQNFALTETDTYSSNNANSDVRVNSQAPWGDRTNKTEIYYINNNPWGYFNSGWGFYNNFFDPFWGYSPFFFRGFYRPYWGLSFYDPYFNFGYGFGFPFYGPRYGFRNFYNNRYERSYARSSYSRGSGRYSYANSTSGGRSSQNFKNLNSSRNQSYSGTVSKNNPTSNTNRYNLGRKPQNHISKNESGQKVTRKITNSQSTKSSNYRSSTQRISPSPYSNSSLRGNYNSRGSYNSSRSSYSFGGRSSSGYSSSSRGSSSGGRASSRGR
jgi:hypothetical protein